MNDGDALRRAKALSTPTRVAVYDHLRRADALVTPQELAALLGVHHTAIRQHLTVLADAGLVASEAFPPSGRGRPRIGYRTAMDPEPYVLLAATLAAAVTDGITAREAGRRQGMTVRPSVEGPLATLRDETQRLGFRPRVRERRSGDVDIVLDACPFADVAAHAPETICQLHRGIAEGVAERTGGLRIVDLHVAEPHHGGCRLVTRLT